MFVKKILLLVSYCLIIGYRNEPWKISLKLLDPIFFALMFYPIYKFYAVLILSCFIYLLLSSIIFRRHKGYEIIFVIIVVFSYSIISDGLNSFNKFSNLQTAYYFATIIVYASVILWIIRGYLGERKIGQVGS